LWLAGTRRGTGIAFEQHVEKISTLTAARMLEFNNVSRSIPPRVRRLEV